MADGDLDYAAVWRDTLELLGAQGMPPRQRSHLQLCQLVGLLEGLAIIKAPNSFTKQFVEQDLRDPVRQALGHHLRQDLQLSVSVDDTLQDADASADPRPRALPWIPTGWST